MIDLIQTILLIYLIAFLSFIVFLCYRVKKDTKVFPIVKNYSSVYGFTDKMVLLSYLFVIINVLNYIFNKNYVYDLVTNMQIQVSGVVLIGVALFFMFLAQYQMRNDWRIGIDTESDIKLVDCGLFRYLRHPIYFFSVIIALSIVLVIPSFVSIGTAIFLWAMVSIQARLEEDFLLKKFGEEYTNYQNTRGRWF